MGISFFLDEIATAFPGIRIAVIRKTRVSLTQSWCKTFAKAMALRGERGHLFIGRTDETRTDYRYRNGSVIVLGGMDNPTRLFSTEYDLIYVNECAELREDEWQSLHRAMRNSQLPAQLLLGDCNPDTEFHWITKRTRIEWDEAESRYKTHGGLAAYFESRHEDNPWLTDTPKGRAYLGRLRDKLTGVVRDRLYLGRWSSAAGAIYPQFSSSTHVIKAQLVGKAGDWKLVVESGMGATHQSPKEVPIVAFVGGQDWGHRAPGCLQVWAIDASGRMYLVREWYMTGQIHSWWAKRAAASHEELELDRVICDNADSAAIQTFNDYLGWKEYEDSEPIAIGCDKTTIENRTNIDLTRYRMGVRDDGWPGILFLESALQHEPDASLTDVAKPTRTHEEVPGYVYEDVQMDQQGREKEDKERPRRVNNHGCNAMEYVVRYCHGRSWDPRRRKLRIHARNPLLKHGITPDTHPEMFGLDEPREWTTYDG